MAAGKEVRFTKLVQESGAPQVVTLWADPKKDKLFMQLVRKGHILTIIQKPTGIRKDFGLIGFHPQPFATYLNFPKPLKNNGDSVVVGVKYDLIKQSDGRMGGRSEPVRKLKPVKPQPVKKLFHVTLRRYASVEVSIRVAAFDAKEAKTEALAPVAQKVLIRFDSTPAGWF
jgi:hypothetical protein